MRENNRYYIDPIDEPFAEISTNFWSYRFENAIRAVWRRNWFVLFACNVVYGFSVPIVTLRKLIYNRQDPIGDSLFRYILRKDSIIHSISWTLLLAVILVLKIFATIIYCNYWIFKNITRYTLIPNAIIASAEIRAKEGRR